jgi:flagellar protein FliO/FliZ
MLPLCKIGCPLMDGLSFLRAIAALAFTLGLLMGCAYLLKRYGHKFGSFSMPVAKGTIKRMQILETISIDVRTRLLLVKIDNTEHLILVSPNGATFSSRSPIGEMK